MCYRNLPCLAHCQAAGKKALLGGSLSAPCPIPHPRHFPAPPCPAGSSVCRPLRPLCPGVTQHQHPLGAGAPSAPSLGPCSPSPPVSAPLGSIRLALATGLILGRENATRDAVPLANFLNQEGLGEAEGLSQASHDLGCGGWSGMRGAF